MGPLRDKGLHNHGRFGSFFAMALRSKSAIVEAVHKNSREREGIVVEAIC
jgi:hypothetical protein